MIALRSSSARRRATGLSLAVRLETLETRTLLSAVTGYNVDDLIVPLAAAVDGNGDLWVTDQTLALVKIHKNGDGTLSDTVFSGNGAIAPSDPTSIVYDRVTNSIFVANPAGGSESGLQEYALDGTPIGSFTTANEPDEPSVLTVATDGSVWFGSQGTASGGGGDTFTSAVGRFDPTTGTFTVAELPFVNTTPVAISAAPDGSVWFGTEPAGLESAGGIAYMGHASATGSGPISLSMFNVPQNVGNISGVAVASDNSVWYLMQNSGNGPTIMDSINHATLSGGSLSVTSYAIPETSAEVANGGTLPRNLGFDSSGQLWFADSNAIDTLDPATGDISRIASNSGAAPADVAISATDVWVTYPGFMNYNLGDVDLTSLSTPIAATSPDITATPGQAFSGPVAVFASSDVGNFNYTINFGNGSSQSGTLASNSSGIYTIDGTTTYATSGTYNTNVVITSDAGDTTSVNGTANVTVSSVPLTSQGINLAAQKGTAIAPNVSGVANVVVAQFSGPVGSYTATINWGDSTSTAGQVVSLGSNQYYVEIPTGSSKTYSAEGTFNVSVVITNGTLSTTATSTATISAVPVVASQNLILQPLLAGIVLNTVANFTADTSSTANWFRATINWGDGTSSVGLVVRTSAGHYTVIGLHIYLKKGTYAVDTTILDSVDAESALATASIKIK